MPGPFEQVAAYIRVSTVEQGESGAGMDAQEEAITREIARRGWALHEMYADVASGKSRARRPELGRALKAINDGRAGTLMVSKLDRLSRSVADFGTIMEEARAGHWNIVIIDLGVDLSTPAGEMVATIMASLAQWERRIISQRTTDALAIRRRDGVTLGRPVTISPEIEALIRTLRRNGRSFYSIAKMLNEDGVPTSRHGARWYPSTIRAVTQRLS